MTVGRKRKPRGLKVVQGTVRKSRDRKEPNFPVVTEIAPPEWLIGADALAEWERLVALLTPVYVLTQADVTNLAHFCMLHGEIVRCYRTWAKEGVAREEVTAAMIAQLRMFASEFGLTPASRSKVTPAADKDAANPFTTLTA